LKQKAKEHQWVETGYVIGFMTNKGVVLDLDNMTYRSAKRLTVNLCRKYKLEGYLLIRSSEKSYHVVFNRYLSWRKITEIVFSQYEVLRWAVMQMRYSALTIRVSKKNGENKPKILLKVGKQDKLIKEYMEIYETFEDY